MTITQGLPLSYTLAVTCHIWQFCKVSIELPDLSSFDPWKKSWIKLPDGSSSMDERQTCWTSAVLWMVLGPPGANADKTADLGSFMDGFGPWQNISNNKTAGPQQFYGWFWAHYNKTAGPQQFYGWFWALRNQCCQNCRPRQFYGWFWTGWKEAT